MGAYQIKKKRVPLSHLFFADDLLLLARAARASMDQVRVVKEVLEAFCYSSGQIISTIKTLIYFSENLSHRETKRLGETIGFTVTSDLGRYLGVPLLHTRVTKNTYSGILEKVTKKLFGWAASSLMLAGRVTLTQLIL